MSQSAVVEVPSTVSGLPTEERILQSVQLHYQTDHQEEFLRLKAQVESLLMELETLSGHDDVGTSEVIS
jgi:hypothetical protein